MKYPVGVQSFEKIRKEGSVYVDKTDLIYSLAHDGSVYFLSRPRRFGKSLLVSTLEAYFSGRKELFAGLKIDSLESEWNTYPVFHLDFSGQNFEEVSTLPLALEEFVGQAEVVYGKDEFATTIGSRFRAVLARAYQQTGRRCVVLIDEYDKPLLDVMGLTIKDCDTSTGSFLLDFPNDEVKRGFVAVVSNNYFNSGKSTDSATIGFIRSLKSGDIESFRTQLTAFLASIPYSMRRKEDEREKERYFHYTFYLILRLLSTYTVYTEKQQSGGRVDCVVEIEKYIYIFEFKLDGSADEALAQIEEKGYAREYAEDARKLYKVGVNFSSLTGTIEDWKVVE